MNYIDKTRNKVVANALVKSYLNTLIIAIGGRYPSDLYENFRNTINSKSGNTYGEDMNHILVSEQQGRCCYCMRTLTPGHYDREHIVVRSANSSEEKAPYFANPSNFSENDIILECEFLDTPQQVPPFPHTVAYENLWISCRGECYPGIKSQVTCNHARGNTFVEPLAYRPNIRNEIIYCTNGFVLWTHDRMSCNNHGTIQALKLNEPVLQLYRRIWYYLASNNLNVDTCDQKSVVNEIAKDLTNQQDMLKLLYSFNKNPGYWNILKEFDWFNNVNVFTP